jgi:hypothetical protein
MRVLYYIIIFIGVGLSTFLGFKKESPFYLKMFSPFLVLSSIIDYSATFIAKKGIHTIPLYNISGVFEFFFYLWIFYSIIKSNRIKKVIIFFVVGYPCLSILNMLFFQGINNFNSITYSLGCLIIIFFSIFYFFELFNAEESYRLSKDPAFWICTGLLFFYSVSFPVYVSVNLMKHFTPKLGDLISFLIVVLNIVLYSLFCVAFICQIKLLRKKADNSLVIK